MLSWIWLWQTEKLTEIEFGMALCWYGQLLAVLFGLGWLALRAGGGLLGLAHRCRRQPPSPALQRLHIGRRYRHRKGRIYTLTDVAIHSESGETLVIYVGDNGITWARPRSMFCDGRFELLEEDGFKSGFKNGGGQ